MRPCPLADKVTRPTRKTFLAGLEQAAGTEAQAGGQPGATLRRLLGREAERFGMGPAVVLGQDLTEAAGPVRDGAVADVATGDRQLGNGHREAVGRRLAHLHL